MDFSSLKRDAAKIEAAIKITPDGRHIALKPITCYFPRRWENAKLATLGEPNRVVGLFVIVTEDGYYAPLSHLARLEMVPTSTILVDIDDSDYVGFFFESGATIIETDELLVDDKIPFLVYDEFFAKGNVPPYMTGEDLAKLETSAATAAGLDLSGTNVPLEIMASAMARDSKNIRTYFRHTIKDAQEAQTKKPEFVALSNVLVGPTNTIARVMGSYFDDGLMSALTHPTERVEGIESLLRQ